MSAKDIKPKFKPFKRAYAHNYVSEIIKQTIISGVYKEGDLLPSELDLCRELGISRSAVREGLRELEGAGLVTTVQGSKGGRLVKKINSDIIANGLDLLLKSQKASFEQLIEARKIIECSTAELAAINRTEEHLKAMLRVVDLSKTSKKNFVKKNYEFHETIALASQNMILFYIVQALRKLIFYSYSLIPMEDIAIENAIESHREIYKAIENRDPIRAKKAIIYDLDSYSSDYHEFIRNKKDK